jgi:excisionase family DNA binding protein
MESCNISLMTVSELAEFLSVSKSLVYRWVEENEIPHYRFGKAVRFNTIEVKEWLDNQKVDSKSEESKDAELERDVDKILSSTIMRAKL